ncbi:ATPase [Chryseobacterium lactis]|uniref:ATPase n=1 Tax=Chryseobacterium lactis TaxID=1241981 RepID=A0A3G6RMJ5_CHRLC|nr:SRPBCC domain-containing protein [Chryseobacterium lactis]AZA82378.1 SRPBCC domain-containing protein [Chryseobacterium lactis]AZB02760.1 SRPBCC domain-containing protein [Chryseobacterium lactis]PNW13946.1 ATPase [Chryseobacterium lactis]
MKLQDRELLITHLFDAAIDVVFETWTDPEKLKHWYAPDGCTINFKFIEVKEGGQFHYCIQHPTHGAAWVIGTYLEIVPSEKLVFTIQLSNEKGDMLDQAGKGWPGEVLTTVTFKSIGDKTEATIHETVSEEEARKTGAYKGWIEMFNKLNKQLTNHN